VQFTKLLGNILTDMNKLIDRIPAIGTALSASSPSVGSPRRCSSRRAITGVSQLIGLLRVAKTEAATAGAVSAIGGAGAAGACRGHGRPGQQHRAAR
jgi:hypothetical protein